MTKPASAALLAFLTFALAVPLPADEGSLDEAALIRRLDELAAKHPGAVELREIGRSRGDLPIRLAVLATPGERAKDERPALLVVAGLDGSHLLGTELALSLAESLAASTDEKVLALLSGRTVYVIPRGNPDGAARFLASPASGESGNDRAIDDDRDGLSNEDPPRDLDGDGHITSMRILDPEGDQAPLAEEPALLFPANRSRGERPTYKVYREGLDSDGDGEIAEDGENGVNIGVQFPHRFGELDDGAGTHAAMEPEARALLDFVLAHPTIALALTLGLDDSLVADPKSGAPEAGKPAILVDPEDLPYYQELGKLYRERTGLSGKPREVPGGTFQEWAYFQFGIFSLSARGWFVPSGEKPAEEVKEEGKKEGEGEKKEGEGEKKEGDGKEEKKEEPDEARKAELARLALARKWERGFREWTPFEHPTLGAIEIGGFVPGFDTNPPTTEVAGIVEKHAWLGPHLLGLLPDVHLADVAIREAGPGLWSVSAAVTNRGYLPLATAQGRRASRPDPVVVRLAGEFELAGSRPEGYRQFVVWDLPGSGGRKEFEWLVSGTKSLAVELSSRRGFSQRVELEVR
ncbi:MAG: hypothetical protein HY720_04375 [Planctomycetes bacterium]|nr:hypothetical protein [Planctomycetota bacterium]